MKKKIFGVVMCVCVLAVSLMGCGKKAAEAETGETKKTIKIGVSHANAGDEYRNTWQKKFEAQAAEKGYEVVATDASDDVSKQISDIENLIAQDCDVIVISLLDPVGIMPALEAINEAGLPSVMIDLKAEDPDAYTCVIGDDGERIGVLQAEYINQWIEEKGVELKLGYVMGMYAMTDTLRMRDRLYKEVGVEEAIVENEGLWNANDAMTIAEDWLQKYPDLNVYVCQNDQMAIGVIQALNAAGKNFDDICVVGSDGLEAGAEYIKNGMLDATVGRDIDKETRVALETCEKVVNGETVEKEIAPNAKYVLSASNVEEHYPD